MELNDKEFFLPPMNKLEQLEELSQIEQGRYRVDVVTDVTALSPADQLTSVQCLCGDLAKKLPSNIAKEQDKFDTLYSFIKHMRLPDVVNRDLRAYLGSELAGLLRKQNKMVEKYLKNMANELNEPKVISVLKMARSATRMYVLLISEVLRGAYETAGDSNNPVVVTTQSIRQPRRRRGMAASDEDPSGVPIASREDALMALVEVLAPEVAGQWVNDTIDEPVLTCILRVALHLVEQKSNVEGDENAVAMALEPLFGNLIRRFTTSYVVAKEANERDNSIPITVPDPSDIIVTPLTELLLKMPQIAKFTVKLLGHVDREIMHLSEEDRKWGDTFAAMLLEAVATAAVNDVTGDTTSAKAIAAFVEEVARTQVSRVHRNSEYILPLLCAESYEIRKCAMTAIAEMIMQKYQNPQTKAEEMLRDKYLEDLLARLRDVNGFARGYCIRIWMMLVERKAVPRRYFHRLIDEAVGRLRDRYHNARRGALKLLQACIQRQWFHNVLSAQMLNKKLAEHSEPTRTRMASMGQDFEAELKRAREAYQPIDWESYMEEAEKENGQQEENQNGATNGDAPHAAENGNGRASGRVSNGSAGARLSNGSSNLSTAAAFDRAVPVDPEVARIAWYEAALHFVGKLHFAMSIAVELLDSRTITDVPEAIEFIVVCYEYRMDDASVAVLQTLVLIFSNEQPVQDAVCNAFVHMYFNAKNDPTNTSLLVKNLARVHRLLGLLANAAEGEAAAVERIIVKLKEKGIAVITESFVDAVFGILDGSLDDGHTTAEERRLAMRMYTLLATSVPRDVALRKEGLLEVMNTHATDNVLLGHAFAALSKESLLPRYVMIPAAIEGDEGHPAEHPVVKLVVHHLCRPTLQLGSWTMMANCAIDAINFLHAEPVRVYQRVAAFLANEVNRNPDDYNRLAQLFFVVGHTAIKHLVAIDCYERAEMKKLDNPQRNSTDADANVDIMDKELGLGTSDHKRAELVEQCANAKIAMLGDKNCMWAKIAPLVLKTCRASVKDSRFTHCPLLRPAAVLALTNLMITNESFCENNLRLLFTILNSKREPWVVKTNVVVSLGDLCAVHPNALAPYMKLDNNGFYALLQEGDKRVRATAVQVCTHLVLNDMLRVGDHLHTIVKLVADEEKAIASNAVMFIKHLAIKMKHSIGNLIPPLIGKLDDIPDADFEVALKTLLEKVEKDKPTESLVVKLVTQFGRFTENKKPKMRAHRIAFCLSELNFSSERSAKLIMSEAMYNKYKQWLRDPDVFERFKSIATGMRRGGGVGTAERRDRATIDEWEVQLIEDANQYENDDQGGDEQEDNDEEVAADVDEDGPVVSQVDTSHLQLLDPTSSDDDDEEGVDGVSPQGVRASQRFTSDTQRALEEKSMRASAPIPIKDEFAVPIRQPSEDNEDGGDEAEEEELPVKKKRTGKSTSKTTVATKKKSSGRAIKKEVESEEEDEDEDDSSSSSDEAASNDDDVASDSDNSEEEEEEDRPKRRRGGDAPKSKKKTTVKKEKVTSSKSGGKKGTSGSRSAGARGRRVPLGELENSE